LEKFIYLRFYGIADKTYFSKSRKNLIPPKNDSDQIFARFKKNGADSFFGVNLNPLIHEKLGVRLTPTFLFGFQSVRDLNIHFEWGQFDAWGKMSFW
jgi:hypothetical protein